jgi:outer membrane receptor protein involved in Fe transport
LHYTGVYKALLLAGCAGTFALAGPAMAQDADESAESTETSIIVTGSRIQRQDFEANSPFVTVDKALLQNSSTAAVESNLNKLPQFTPAQTPTAGGDIQPTATNTPGAATVSLRGIGVNRNLVLMDGRRATPSNASMAVDITTIPSAAVERVEIISGGASATYGADAIAGVTNFILKKDFQGIELDGQMGITQEGDGFEYQLSGIMGTDFADGRGNISIAMSTNRREASFQRDREWYRSVWADPSIAGNGFFTQFPGILFDGARGPNPTGGLAAAFPNSSLSPNAGGTTVYLDQNGNPFVNATYDPDGPFAPGFNVNFEGYTGPIDNFTWKKTDVGLLAQNDTYLYLILPLTRYNFFMRGNYEINDWIGVFAQGLYSHVSTSTANEPGPIFAGWGVSVDPDTLDQDQLPQSMWDLLNSRADPGAPFTMTALMPELRETFTDVSTYNMIAGFEGSIPGTDWTWEAFVNHGESETYAKQTGVYSLSRLRTVLNSGNFGEGFSRTGNAEQGGFGASTGTCTSGLNFFVPPAGGFSEDCLEAIRADLKNRSTMRQTIAEANIQGGLFELPAGQIRAALGASYRENAYKFDNDTLTTQGRSFEDQALGIYPSGNVNASISVKELYGELLIPVLADVPFIQQLDLELGGRMSHYDTTGTSYTYKLQGTWEVNDWLRFRGGYNRAERAPNIGELYLAAQQTFAANTVGDLCSLANPTAWSANPANANGGNVEAICRELMNQADRPGFPGEAASSYYSGPQSTSTFGFAFPTTIGNPNLTPEKADTWTAGLVLQSPWTAPALSRLRLSVDWFNIKVDDAIGVQSIAIAMRQCFDAALNPLVTSDPVAAANSQFCQNVPRNAQNGGLGNVKTTYVNNARFEVQGIDAQLDWGMDVGPGTLGLNVLFNYLLDFKAAELPTDPMVDYVGTQGTGIAGMNSDPYEYRIFANVNYSIDGFRLGLEWQHWPSVDNPGVAQFGASTTTGAPAYDLFALNGSYAATDNVTLRFGVDNLFNKAPPLTGINTANTNPAGTGNLPGGSIGGGIYDTNGRRFYLGANVRF